MPKQLKTSAGATSQTEYVIIEDMNGSPITGLVYNSTNLVAKYVRAGAAVSSISLVTQTVSGAWSSGGFVEVDSTNLPGLYRFDVPDAAFAAGVDKVIVGLYGYTGMRLCALEYEIGAIVITGTNNDKTGYSLTQSFPSNFSTLSIDGSGRVDIGKISGTSQTARDIGASVLLSSGTGTGQVSLSSGAVTVGTNNDKTGYALSSSQTFNVTGNITGNLSGSVGSVTGAVGSVTGNVGGNVTGSVGSVTGSVGSVVGNVGGNVTGSTASVLGSVGSVTGNVGGNVTGSVGSVAGNVSGNVIGSVGSVTSPVSIASGQLFVKKNTAFTLTFPMTDSTTHTPKIGLTVTSNRTIDGGSITATTNSVTELGGGLYVLQLSSGDTNGSMVTLQFTATGADTRFIGIVTQS